MGLPDFSRPYGKYSKYYTVHSGHGMAGTGTKTIFEYNGSGEVVSSNFKMGDATGPIDSQASITLSLDGYEVFKNSIREMVREVFDPQIDLIYIKYFAIDEKVTFALPRKLSFNKSIKVEFSNGSWEPLNFYRQVALGLY